MSEADEISDLHHKLAAETLRADLGWQRYEVANSDRNELRARMASEDGHFYDIDSIVIKHNDADGKEDNYFDENEALACLLVAQVAFCNQRKYVCLDGTSEKSTTVIFMSCNDVFAWGCADGEDLINDDIEPLFKMWHADKQYGYVRWVCIKRNEKPQAPFVKGMKTAGAWDEVMEALPDNTYDAYLRARKAAP